MKKLLLFLSALAATFAAGADAHAQRRVLVYGSGGLSSINYLRTLPEVTTGPTRAEFTIATDAQWRAMTTEQFASYNALWIDGGNCTAPADRGAAIFQPVTDTRLTWSPAITGHFELIGADSDLHIGHPGDQKFTRNSYHYVTSGAGTGIFVSMSCLFLSAPVDTPVPWLQGLGDFRMQGDGCIDGQVLEPASATHPVHIGISPPSTTIVMPTDLAWSCFTHAHFTRHPPSFQRIYSTGMVGPGRGVVIVNDRGGCVVDVDCLPGQFCNRDAMGENPTCRTTRGNGRDCTTNADCTSGVCTEGVCCDRLCNSQCESCRNAGSVGLCTATTGAPVAPRAACTNFGTTCGGRCDGTNRTECSFPNTMTSCAAASCSMGTAVAQAFCDGRGACGTARRTTCDPFVCGPTDCLSMCASDADCVTGYFCREGRCAARIPPGRACTSSAECSSGFCVDGVCCNAACAGQCEACDNPDSLGTCSPIRGTPHGGRRACAGTGTCGGACDGTNRTACTFPNDQTQCGMPSCMSGTETQAATCDGRGSCSPARSRDCGRYACSATACRTSCDTDVECAAGNFCRDGMCVASIPNGMACTASSQCVSGMCVDGVCCNAACDGQCEACNVEGSAGTCTPTMGAPRGSRPACAGMGSCAGTCDGSSRTACAYPGSSVECRAASCADGVATNRGTCDGAGLCSNATTTQCRPYTCDGNQCRSSCTTAADCVDGNRCEMGRCVPRAGLGTPCSNSGQCGADAVCSDGVCCNRACDGVCESCALPATAGVCTPLPANTQVSDAGVPGVCICNGSSGNCAAQDAGPPPDDASVPMDAAPIVAYRGGGCGCSTPGQSDRASVLGVLALAAAAAGLRRRRR
ncbi:MAG: dickkopf-related protein [Polyangiales bacterium]